MKRFLERLSMLFRRPRPDRADTARDRAESAAANRAVDRAERVLAAFHELERSVRPRPHR